MDSNPEVEKIPCTKLELWMEGDSDDGDPGGSVFKASVGDMVMLHTHPVRTTGMIE